MRSRGGAFGSGQRTFLSFNAPTVIWVIVVVTVVASLTAAIGGRNGFPLGAWTAFVPSKVLQGQLWRLVTWPYVEDHPISLIFNVLMHIWFSAELCRNWGVRRFLAIYFGFIAGAAALTLLVGFLWHDVMFVGYSGGGAIADAMIIAWATMFPTREIYIYFVLPLRGRGLIAVTLVGTALYAMYYGVIFFIPHFFAELGMLAYMGGVRQLIRRWQVRRSTRQQVAKIIQMRPRQRDNSGDDDDGGGAGPSGSGGKRWLN
jgi:membrane associated rhomboid family serine protease